MNKKEKIDKFKLKNDLPMTNKKLYFKAADTGFAIEEENDELVEQSMLRQPRI